MPRRAEERVSPVPAEKVAPLQLAPEDLAHIFDRFWQSKTSGDLGTGLGLSIARALVELHGGTIRAESTPGEGATFRALLPRAIVALERGDSDDDNGAANTQ